MLMDVKLLPIYKKALNNDPESILKIADAYKFGEGVPQNDKTSHFWYEKLLSFKNLPYVEYEYCYTLGAKAAYERKQYKLAYKRLCKSIQLFVRKHGAIAAIDKLNEFNFFDTYYHIKVLNDSNA